MIDPSFNIRSAVATALSGITWNGQEVVIYDEMAAPDATFPRILLLDVTGGGARFSKCGFGADWSQVIKVSTAFSGRVTKNPLEYISNEILSRLVPKSGDFIDIGPDFNVWDVTATLSASQSYTDGIKQYIDKNIRITYSITEK